MNHVGDIILNEKQVSLQFLEVVFNKETFLGSSTLLFNFMILYYFRCCSCTQITFLGCSSISFVLLFSSCLGFLYKLHPRLIIHRQDVQYERHQLYKLMFLPLHPFPVK